MNFLRGFFSFIISLVIFILLIVLSLSYSLEGFIKGELLKGVIQDKIVSENIGDKEVKQSIENLLGQEEITGLLEELVDEYMKYSKNDEYRASDEFKQKVIDFSVKNIDIINKFTNDKMTEERLRSEEFYNDLTNDLEEGFSNAKEALGDKDIIIEVFNFSISTLSRTILLIVIVVLIILLALVNWSLYNWFSYVSTPLFICGLLFTLIYVLISKFSIEIAKTLDISINIDPKYILTIGIVEISVSILLVILKIIMTKANKPVYSEGSNEETYLR